MYKIDIKWHSRCYKFQIAQNCTVVRMIDFDGRRTQDFDDSTLCKLYFSNKMTSCAMPRQLTSK